MLRGCAADDCFSWLIRRQYCAELCGNIVLYKSNRAVFTEVRIIKN